MSGTPRALEFPLVQVPFYSIEYPGYVSPTSVPIAIQNLGGQSQVDNAFIRTASKTDALIELSLRPGNPFAHPIPGNVVNTNNILLRVVKKKRKRGLDHYGDGAIGEYTTQAVGIIPKTVRFRSMVDFQYQPNSSDPVANLRLAMNKMDVDTLSSYAIAEEKSEYLLPSNAEVETPVTGINLDSPLANTSSAGQLTSNMRSNLRLFPPPLFSRQTIPQGYNFKANPASIVSTTVDETGEEKKRMINRMRWKGYGPATIMFSDSHVPEKPPQAVQEGRSQINETILKRLEELFSERPVWTRMSLFNQFTFLETREILNSKLLLPLVCYVFQDGPWRDTLVRFKYDPRTDSSARFYQRLYFRNANHPIARPSVISRRQERSTINELNRPPEENVIERKNSHIFDGKTVTKDTAAFQLCDISDPMLQEMIEDTDGLREVCNDRDGWYTTHAFERIKTVLRHKFFSLLEGHIVTDEECQALLTASEGAAKVVSSNRSQKLRAGKHNMAKGALRPEDAAVMRLRATLDRNAKSLQSQR